MSNSKETRVLVLQGGGALGAYQAGAYEALVEAEMEPDWIAGISIGAINAAIIAGNPPGRRIEHLRKFWEKVSSVLGADNPFPGEAGRTLFNEMAANYAVAFGLPGFFKPRIPPAVMLPRGDPGTLSYYDTEPLRDTLEEMVDFASIGKHGPRLSVGAVNIGTGNFAYFDSTDTQLGAAHVMASGALPPGFPPVEIDGEYYWDGGLVSNTPLQFVLQGDLSGRKLCIFQVDLFSARGPMPKSLLDVAEREKDIRFSSRTRLNTDTAKAVVERMNAAARLYEKLPARLKNDPDALLLKQVGAVPCVTIMHLIHRMAAYEIHSKDYEFSRLSVDEHWNAGRRDVLKSLSDPKWKSRKADRPGLQVFDLGADAPHAGPTQ